MLIKYGGASPKAVPTPQTSATLKHAKRVLYINPYISSSDKLYELVKLKSVELIFNVKFLFKPINNSSLF